MRATFIIASVIVLLLALASCQLGDQSTPHPNGFVGRWVCGPTVMHGSGFDISLITTTERFDNGHFSSRVEATVSQPLMRPVVNVDAIYGTWSVDGQTYSETINSARFISSTDPNVTPDQGQARHTEQLNRSRLYKSQILEVQQNRVRTIPIESEYKEAEVELDCRRA